jgi:hypothetical protein
MEELLKKLNYKGQKSIAVINAEKNFLKAFIAELKDASIHTEIDQRCPYEFILLFVKSIAEVDYHAPLALHNLTADGIIWFCYPKKSSKKFKSDLERERGWKALNDLNFHSIRMISIDDDWSAMRFRNIKFIKSTSGRFEK